MEEIRAANRASALEQQEQDERNDELRADMRADRLVNGQPRRPHYKREQTFQENIAEQLADIQADNVKANNQRNDD